MSAGTVSSTSTYQPGKGMSFAKDIGSRVLDAAISAKNEKKLQEKIEAEGGTVPESAKKGLFAKALKTQFITNPVNDLKKSFNKKLSGAANIVGLFGKKGRALEDKMLGKKFSTRKGGFDRSGYQKASQGDDDDGGGGGGGGGSGVATLGSLVLDVQAIASTVSSMQGLINTQMSISSQISTSLDDIKNVLSEQVSLQQQRISGEEMASREASLESSQQTSGTAAATSTFQEGDMLGGLLGMFGDLKNLFGIIKNLPRMFMGLLRGILSKIPGGKQLLGKFGGKVAGETAEAGAKGLAKGMLGKFLRPIFKRIPIIGGLIDFAVSLALGEPVGRAAAKAAGAMLGGSLGGILGTIIPGPGNIVGAVLGGIAGDWVGGSLYDMIAGAFGGKKDEKMAAGGAMIGEAGKEAVVNLDSAQGRGALGGGGDNSAVGDTYFKAIAGTTLAVTRDFVEGLGPVGAAIAPAIQDDVAKLGREFDLPATAVKMSIGGLGLRKNPQAKQQGEQFLKELVKGTLENLFGKEKKDKDKKKSSGGSSGGGDTTTPPPAPSDPSTPTGGGKNDMNFGDSISSGLAGRTGGTGVKVTDNTGSSSVGASPATVLSELKAFDASKLKGKTIRLSSGISNNTADLANVEEQLKYLTGLGAKVQLVGVSNKPPKNLEKSLAGMNEKLSALASKYSDKGVRFLGGFVPAADGIHPADYSQLNTSYNVDVQAASGISIDTSGGGRKKLGANTKFSSLNLHHGSGDSKNAYGITKDYVAYSSSNPNNYDVDVPTPVDAKVKFAGEKKGDGYGKSVELTDMNDKPLALFGHFNKLKVATGQNIKAGQSLGIQGYTGSVSPTGAAGQHIHIDGSPAFHEKFVNWITMGKPISSTDSSGNTINPEDDTDNAEPEEDPFTAMEKGIKGMLVGLGTMGAGLRGEATDKAGFDKTKSEFEAIVNAAPATPTPPTPGRPPTPAAGAPAPKTQTPGRTSAAPGIAAIPISMGSQSGAVSLSRSTAPESRPGFLAPV